MARDVSERRVRHRVVDERPDLVEESAGSADPLVTEVATFLERSEEHQVEPEAVGAPALDVLVRYDDVPLGLRHLRAVLDDEAVRTEFPERLLEVDVTE